MMEVFIEPLNKNLKESLHVCVLLSSIFDASGFFGSNTAMFYSETQICPDSDINMIQAAKQTRLISDE